MPNTRTHLVIGTPCYGGLVSSGFTTSLMRLQAACAHRGDIDLSVNLLSGDALIPRARQNIVAHFLNNPSATHLLFVDADITFGPEQALRLLDFDAPLAAGVYPTKRVDWPKVISLAKAGMTHLESTALSYVLELEDPSKIVPKNGFAKVRYAGTGFMMIQRETLLKMIEAYPALRYKRENQAEDPLRDSPYRSALFNGMIDEATGVYLSEDYSFCRRWTDLGGEIWADLQSRLDHVGTMIFRGDMASQFMVRSEAKS
ncbi:MAG TPA: hypothetical protein VHE12_06470 [bacterium]|nr:hypothetical protein [bacterium]